MGLFDFFKGKEEDEIKPEEILLQDVDAWLIRNFRHEMSQAGSRAGLVRREMEESFLAMEDALRALDKSRFLGKERIHTAANMIKDGFVKKSYSLLRNLKRTEPGVTGDFSYIQTLSDRASQVLGEMKATTPKQSLLLSHYFRRESDALVESIKRSEEAIRNAKDFQEGDGRLLSIEDSVKKGKERYNKLSLRRQELEGSARDAREAIKRSQEERKGLEESYLELLRSQAWKKLGSLEVEHKKEGKLLSELNSRLSEVASPLSRPLKKLKHEFGDALGIPSDVAELIYTSPEKALASKPGREGLLSIIELIKESLEMKRFSLKPSEIQKLENMKLSLKSEVPEILKERRKTRDKINEIGKELEKHSKLQEEKKTKELEIGKLSEEITNLEDDLKRTLAEKTLTEKEMNDTKRNIEKLVFRSLGRRLVIST